MEFPYIVCLALIEQGGKRFMPLGGRSLKQVIEKDSDPGDIGYKIALELLLRVFQLSEASPITQAINDNSLVLIQIPLVEMQDKLPSLKASWIETGNHEVFFSKLNQLCDGVWNLKYVRYKGICFDRI